MYDLELARAVQTIKDKKAKLVCIQLPEGLKPETQQIVKELESKTHARVITWMGSCYGACDLPNVEELGVDLLIQWGHSAWSP
ncbi:diphthamide synthesis protein [Candidatus Woesearchaeota archaeon]|nr:diphthamide synthesis protein [Candidatus Woesearchaeota archaeon]